ncbi:hypothetical protein FBT96_17070 [Rhodobacter capsulatus]|uniref:Uncharacterized protein n=1 Tax=Rhodobacter capsulatus TaxID=1061 RepID=A0A4U1JM49_RHOCA|nr:hypothetical protein FBT96_17070 [Rhodobacter capsulatus]
MPTEPRRGCGFARRRGKRCKGRPARNSSRTRRRSRRDSPSIRPQEARSMADLEAGRAGGLQRPRGGKGSRAWQRAPRRSTV